MGNRGTSLVLGVVIAVVLGTAAAFGYKQIHSNQTASVQTPSPSPSVASPSPSVDVTPSPSPSIAPSPSPAASPTAPPAAAGPAAYPPQIKAGSSYTYSGSGTLLVGATDGADSVTSVCAGINDSAQSFPAGYEGVYFVGIQFGDGYRVSAGYTRSSAGRLDFGTVQIGSAPPQGVQSAGPSGGSHLYCVSRGPSGWVMSDDGTTIYATSVETAAASTGPLLFESSAQREKLPAGQAAPPQSAFQLVVPGMLNLVAGGKAPTQLTGFVRAI